MWGGRAEGRVGRRACLAPTNVNRVISPPIDPISHGVGADPRLQSALADIKEAVYVRTKQPRRGPTQRGRFAPVVHVRGVRVPAADRSMTSARQSARRRTLGAL